MQIYVLLQNPVVSCRDCHEFLASGTGHSVLKKSCLSVNVAGDDLKIQYQEIVSVASLTCVHIRRIAFFFCENRATK